MKRFIALFVLLMLAVSVSMAAAETLNVNIWDNNQLAGLKQIADEWSAQSGIDVNINVVDWDNYWTLLEAGAYGGDLPDVFWTHSNTVQMYMDADLLLKLNDYIDKDEAIAMTAMSMQSRRITIPSPCCTTRPSSTNTVLNTRTTTGPGKMFTTPRRKSPKNPKVLFMVTP